MHVSKIRIQNFRLLIDTEVDIDPKTTLIVGRNNTAKTSFFECITRFLSGRPLLFNDYPLAKRKNFLDTTIKYMNGEVSFEELRQQIELVSIEFTVDYSAAAPEESLGALSPFIIDMEEDITTARIRAEYRLTPDEEAFKRSFKNNDFIFQENLQDKDYRNIIVDAFEKLFELKIYAINPANENRQIKKLKELQDLFPFYFIPAERTLGEDDKQRDSLANLISDFFDMKKEDWDEDIFEKIRELRSTIIEANKNIQTHSEKLLSGVVNKAIGFGYPNAEELQLGVMTKLDIDEQIKNKSVLSFSSADEECLPSSHNGLGYKNLIKIAFLLASFTRDRERRKDDEVSIPLLFIEEPESHMHPQMQRAFASYLGKFLEKLSESNIQVLLTSHSSQIANSTDFSKIRYVHKKAGEVEYKNLNSFASENKENIKFIKKYLTLTRCDLFFADKIILVEGTSERLLIPDMIDKCDKQNLFGSGKFRLPTQYYALMEVGGAHAYIFIPFIEFLGIPALILTDIDTIGLNSKTGNVDKGCLVSEALTTSNQTIKWWIRKNKGLKENSDISFEDVKSLSKSGTGKTINNCHIEFQTIEDGFCGRSLEESIRNVNRLIYGLTENMQEEGLTNKKKKTDFALELIEREDYVVPEYIRLGLQWLNEQ